MDSLHLCLEILRFGVVDGCLCLALPQRTVGNLAYNLAAFCIYCTSVGFAFRFPPPNSTFLEIDAPLLEYLGITRLLLDSIAYLVTWVFCLRMSCTDHAKTNPWHWIRMHSHAAPSNPQNFARNSTSSTSSVHHGAATDSEPQSSSMSSSLFTVTL